jgi:hypothetical protein
MRAAWSAMAMTGDPAHEATVVAPGYAICPRCTTPARKGTFAWWVLLAAVCLFPLGLLALLIGPRPTLCPSCGYSWKPDQDSAPERHARGVLIALAILLTIALLAFGSC